MQEPAPTAPNPPEFAFTIAIEREPAEAAISSEAMAGGARLGFTGITGGWLRGPGVEGRVLRGGGEWTSSNADGTVDRDARFMVLLDGDDMVRVHDAGLWTSEPRDGARYQSSPRIEVEAGAHERIGAAWYIGLGTREGQWDYLHCYRAGN